MVAAPNRRTGRPPKPLDADKRNRFILALKGLNYIDTAAAFAGIPKSTLYWWMQRAHESERDPDTGAAKNPKEQGYVEFLDDVEKALAEAEVRALGLIDRAAAGGPISWEVRDPDGTLRETIRNVYAPQWQAAAWRLERRLPEKYSRTDRYEVSGRDGKPVEVDSASSGLRLLGKLAQLASSRGEGGSDRDVAGLPPGRTFDAE